MKWISPKDELPETGDIVLIKLNYYNPYLLITKYFDNLSSLDGDYEKIFILMVPPNFPKEWCFDKRYSKISRIPKKKVKKWALLTKGHLTKDFFENIDKE